MGRDDNSVSVGSGDILVCKDVVHCRWFLSQFPDTVGPIKDAVQLSD